MKDIIKSIYLNYSQTEEYCQDSRKHETAYRKAYNKFVTDFENEGVLLAATAESEMFGFMQGFKFAMQLKKECDAI